MAGKELERIRNAVLDSRYTLTEHATEEMNNDQLDILDVEAALLTGTVKQALTHDPRGTRYVVAGLATDQNTIIEIVVRFVRNDDLLVLTVYEVE